MNVRRAYKAQVTIVGHILVYVRRKLRYSEETNTSLGDWFHYGEAAIAPTLSGFEETLAL